MKITATIQARLGSTRLPGKVLKDMAGKPMLQQHVERIQKSRLINETVIATTTNPEDDAVETLAKKIGVSCFRGSENDVLSRVASLLKTYSVDVHVELFGDSPLTDVKILDEVIEYFLKNEKDFDFVSNGIKVTYPAGMEANVYRAQTLIRVDQLLKATDPLREHVGTNIQKNPVFRCKNLEAPPELTRPDLYLEVDTEKDYQVLSAIFSHFAQKGAKYFSLAEILKFIDTRPDLAALNQNEHRRWKSVKNIE